MADLEASLRNALRFVNDEYVRGIGNEVPAARAELERKARRRGVAFAVEGMAAAALVLALAVFAGGVIPRFSETGRGRASGFPSVVAEIDVPGTNVMEPALGSLWVTHDEGVVEIDPSSSQISRRMPWGSSARAMTSNHDTIFTSDFEDRSISAIPIGTNRSGVATILDGVPGPITSSDESVWYAVRTGDDGDHSIVKASAESLDVEAELSSFEQGDVAHLVYSEGRLWASVMFRTATRDMSLVNIDPDDGERQEIELSPRSGLPIDLAVGEGAVWILRTGPKTGGNWISRYDIEAGQLDERAVSFRQNAESIEVAEGYLWATVVPAHGPQAPAKRTRSSLYMIDPTTREAVGRPLEVSHAGAQVTAGEGYLWVSDPVDSQIIQVDPVGAESPPVVERSPTPQTDDTTLPRVACGRSLPFEPDRPWSMALGSGSQIAVPLAEQEEPRALVHYSDSPDRHIDVIPSQSEHPRGPYEEIVVLGLPGRLTQLRDAVVVSFRYADCGYQLVARGYGSDAVRRFAEKLVPVVGGGASPGMGGFALWPETAPAAAFESCSEPDDYRRSAQAAAVVFADRVLDWSDVQISSSELGDGPDRRLGQMSVRVRRSSPSATVELTLYELARECWSVISARTPDSDAESYLSVGKREGKLRVGIDLNHEPYGDDVERLRLITWSGHGTKHAEISVVRRDYEKLRERGPGLEASVPDGPTAFVLLLENEDLEVIGVVGQPLPSSDFAAG